MKEMDERYGHGCFRPCECFMTAQSVAPDGSITWRCIDNHKGNENNSMAWSVEVISLANPAFPAKIGCWFDRYAIDHGWAVEGYLWDMGSGTDDGLNAFRFCPNNRPAYQCRYVMNPVTHETFGFEIPGFSFGHGAAMYNYSRTPEMICDTARSLFAVPSKSYVDDICVPEPDFCRGQYDAASVLAFGYDGEGRSLIGALAYPDSGQGIIAAIAIEIGVIMSYKKHVPWAITDNAFVGVVTDFTRLTTDGEIELCVKPSTSEKVKRRISEVRAANACTPSTAGSLKGKSLWCLNYGGVGSVALHALSKRQYSRDGETALSPELDSSLCFLEALLGGKLPKLIVRARDSGEFPTLVLSDASWQEKDGYEFGLGYMAYIVYCPRARKIFFAWTEMPQDMLEFFHELRAKKQYICQGEIQAMHAPYTSNPLHIETGLELDFDWKGRDVLHLADNTAANSGVVSGGSRAPDMARIASAMRIRIAHLRIRLWVDFVKSEANFADDPSRENFTLLLEMGAIEVKFVMPPYREWGEQ